jgi:periplasmic divalent cation tolerance protein
VPDTFSSPYRVKFCWIYTTTSSKREAQKISSHLLNKKLIACANIFSPIESHYRWKSKNQKSKEFAVVFKTRSALYKKIEKEISKIHSYECPCIVEIPWLNTSKTFGQWIISETKTPRYDEKRIRGDL